MGNLIENRIIFDLNKARTGRYEDNSKNRRLHRVGQEYGNKGGEKEDEKSSEKKDDNSRIIQALESKIEQMKKNKHIFVEQGGEVRYNRALETLQSKLDSVKGEERKESVRDKASEAGDGKAEEKEPFTRVKFDDLPNSGKVNLKKYLSGKRREKIDSQWKDAGKISDADLKKMEAGLVKKFNDSFDSSSKSQRAEDLYNIMKVKGELQKRGNETKKDGKTKSQENSKEKSMVMNISDDDLKVNSSLKSSSKRRAVLKKVYKIINDIYGDNGYRLENGELNPEWYESNNYLFNRASKINNL